MDSGASEVARDFRPFLRVYKDGRVERYELPDRVHSPPPPRGLDPSTGIESKDVVIPPEISVPARIYVPETTARTGKLPLLVHYHGGGFCVGSPFNTIVNDILSTMVTRARVVPISVGYRYRRRLRRW